jgi:serine/threonine protein kinase
MLLSENMVVAERFKLSKMIGRGGMGSVWQATDLRLSTTCALKFIEGEMANMAEAHSRFQREAQAAAQLRSPHVVQIFDHGVWQGHPYIAMELLDGEDLGKRIAKQEANGGRLSTGVVNAVVQQVCRALSKAHAAGVVHRDLKPDNIFLVNDDDREIVKILDFGVAKSASQAIDGSNTKTGAMLGTPYYMSPEQAQGIKSVDSRSDLWSLAVIVFQCLTGRLPFESEALGDLLVKIIVNPIPQPSSYNSALPATFDQWWLKAADRNPDNRFPNAKAFAETLALALGQSSVTDVQDRSRLMRQAGGTAMMTNEVLGNVANTPMPGAHTAALATPNPHQMHTPQHQVQQPYAPLHVGAPMPMMQTPQHAPQYAAVSANNPAMVGTFSGVEPTAGLPKKGTPVALFVTIGLLALVGLGFGGAAFMVKGRAAAQGSAGASASGVASAAPEASASAAVAADPTPPASATAASAPEPPASASATAAANPVPAGAGGGAHRPIITGGGAAAAKTQAPKIPTAATAPTTPVTAAASATAKGKEKPINLGF